MAFVPMFGTGFEIQGAVFNGSYVESDAGVSATQKKSGGYSLLIDYSKAWNFYLPSSQAELYMGIWQYVATNTAVGGIQFILDDGKIIELKQPENNPYVFDIYVDNSLVKSYTALKSYMNIWQNLQFHIKVADSGGVIQMKLDGNLVIDYTGDTKPGTGTVISRIRMYSTSNTQTTFTCYYDDLIIGTGDWTGDYRFEALNPVADTAQKDFTPSAGTDNYACVDEVPVATADYVYTSTNGAKDLYELSDFNPVLGINTKIPKFLIQWLYGKKDPANAQSIKMVQKLGATEYQSSAKDLLTTETYLYDVRTTDPDGNPWTDTNIDNLLVGQVAVIP